MAVSVRLRSGSVYTVTPAGHFKDAVMEEGENQWQILEGGDSLFNFCRVSMFLINIK